TSLTDSPLVAGNVYGFRTTRQGPGMVLGRGSWVQVPASYDIDPDPTVTDLDLRKAAATLKFAAYYRPEDIDIDRGVQAQGNVKWCVNNTGREQDQYFGETVCLSDGTLTQAGTNAAVPEMQEFVVGNPQLAMPDNMAYQPGTGNWLLHEDGETDYLGSG